VSDQEPLTEVAVVIGIDMVPIEDVLANVRRCPKIATEAEARYVAEQLAAARALRITIAATFDPHIARAYDAHRALCADKRATEAPAAEAEALARALLAGWAEAEDVRVRAERALAATTHTETIEDLHAAADVADAAGDHVTAEEVRLAAASTPPPMVRPRAPIAGVSVRETWTARVDDLLALVKAVAKNPAWLPLLKPDHRALDAQAASLRARLAIPGVTALRSTGIAARKTGGHR
jgi:hypothetical protein